MLLVVGALLPCLLAVGWWAFDRDRSEGDLSLPDVEEKAQPLGSPCLPAQASAEPEGARLELPVEPGGASDGDDTPEGDSGHGALTVQVLAGASEESASSFPNGVLRLRRIDADVVAPTPPEQRTDEDGRASWERVPIGRYYLSLRGVALRYVDILESRDLEVTWVISGLVDVRGFVHDEVGHPIENAVIRISEYTFVNDGVLLASTDASGSFAFRTKLEAKRYISAAAEGFESSPIEPIEPGDVDSSGGVTLEFSLPSGGRVVAGRVVDSGGRAVAAAKVQMRPHSTTATRIGESASRWRRRAPSIVDTDSEGRFRFAGLPLAGFELWVTCPTYAQLVYSSNTLSDSGKEILLVIEPEATVEGTVTDQYGEPVLGANVGVGSMGSPGSRWVRSDEEGRFALDTLGRGDLRVLAFKAGYESKEVELRLSLGEARQGIVLVLSDRKGRPVKGRIEPPESPLGGQWSVLFEADGEKMGPRVTDGEFTVASWTAPMAEVTVYATGYFYYVALRQRVTIPEEGPLILRVDPERALGTTVTGRIVGGTEGELTRYIVGALAPGCRQTLPTRSSLVDGSFSIRLPRRGQWMIEISHPDGWSVAARDLGVLTEAVVDLGEIRAADRGRLHLVSGIDAGFSVGPRVAIVNSAGRFEDTDVAPGTTLSLPPGWYGVREYSSRAVNRYSRVEVRAFEESTVTLGFDNTRRSSIRVDLPPDLLRNAWLTIEKTGQGEIYAGGTFLTVGDQDSWALACEPGDYRVSVTVGSEELAVRHVVVPADGEARLDLSELGE